MEEKKKTTGTKKSNSSKKSTSVKKEVKKDTKEKELTGRYCANCGRKLNENEVCKCLEKNETIIQLDKKILSEKSKGIWETIINVYKKPYSVCKEEFKNIDIKNSIIMLVLIALSLGLLICSVTYASFHISSNNTNTFAEASKYYDIPYFKIFVVWSLISFIMGFLPIVISHLAGTLFSKKRFDFNSFVNLYASSMSVVILINIISSAFIFSGVFIRFFLLISLFTLLFGVINYLFIYKELISFEKEKESYIFLGIIMVWLLGMAVTLSLFTSGIDGLNAFDNIVTMINN